MRVFFIVDETCFFHPEFIEGVLTRGQDTFVGAALVTRSKNSPERYVTQHFYELYPSEIWKLGWKKIGCMLSERFFGKTHSVRKVLQTHKLPFFTVRDTINTPVLRARIAAFEPDVIVSSNPLYFGKKLLALPRIACINRHSSLLPNNGGVWPGFQAVRKGESVTGVSVHTMTPVIDEGVVLDVRVTPICEGESLTDIYARCFALSVDAVLGALDKLRAGDLTPVETPWPHNYYSWPTHEQWKEFRAHGGRYI